VKFKGSEREVKETDGAITTPSLKAFLFGAGYSAAKQGLNADRGTDFAYASV
jgi:hypothetical protein